ncbi:MAG: hypothetical protein KAJ54_02500 [Candidatus Aenigmarchaeota archaeon]|nr:hypothetical protein [Candidatus Aenigmarchaeota archaeon]MCK5322287.1 hypothetical protein [Candidatus Aenigmarchaeota archaeon]
MKFKCDSCGKELHVEHHHDKLHGHEGKIKCKECEHVFEPPTCCGQKMYVAS